jgi:hypothetical protein
MVARPETGGAADAGSFISKNAALTHEIARYHAILAS